MNIALINVSGLLSSEGSRLVSALLKRAGHSVKNVYLPRQRPLRYSPTEIERLDTVLRDARLAMVAVYSAYATRAIAVTDFVHQSYPGMQVIWGGPHCVSAPQLSLRHADGVCFAEGDQAVVDLATKMASGREYRDTPNMAFKGDGGTVQNGVLPPFADLDSLPYPDYDLRDQFILDHDLLPMTKELLRKYYPTYPFRAPTYFTLTARGCPHQCSYCNNCRYVAMHGRNPMRYRGVDHVIGELQTALCCLDFCSHVGFGDDDFLMRPLAQLEEFAAKYRERIGRPFFVAVSANTYARPKIDVLLDAGLKLVQIGFQSGSQRALAEVYNRTVSVAATRRVVKDIESYPRSRPLQLLVDFIIDNPYETPRDILETYLSILDISPRTRLNVFVLNFFPGTPLYDRAVKDGIIDPDSDKTYRLMDLRSPVEYQKNYETLLILLVHLARLRGWIRYIPPPIFRLLGSRPFRAIASRVPQRLHARMIERLRLRVLKAMQ